MNKFINLIIVCAVILSLSNLSCEKEGNLDKGIITGFDNRMCPCCGGLLINFKVETQSYVGEFYLIKNPPEELGINPDTKFPLHVKVRWTQEGLEPVTCALANLIRVTNIRRLN